MRFFRSIVMALGLLAGPALHALGSDDPASQLLYADSIKTSHHDEFLALLNRLQHRNDLAAAQQAYLQFLVAWQTAFSGNYPEATRQLDAVINQVGDASLRFRANATLINILGIAHRYEDAFRHLNQMTDDLPQVTDRRARFQGTGEAAQLLIGAGQYDQAVEFANRMMQSIPSGESTCKPLYFKLHALFRHGDPKDGDPPFQQGLDVCTAAKEPLIADALRTDIAIAAMNHGQPQEAIDVLAARHPAVEAYHYPALLMQYDALLAQAYWKLGKITETEHFAHATIDAAIKQELTEPLSIAYSLLYQIEDRRGHADAALRFHEKYMAADKGYLDDITARTLAYQIVTQQLKSRKLELDALSKYNRILQLQQELDRKAVETSRLYILLLITVLGFGGVLLYRIRRSQLRFMRLARQDGLTGIFNRQHFVEEATQALRLAQRNHRTACLILIDLDHFKSINDTHGHAAGDLVLQRMAHTCKMRMRTGDVFGRLGGEEFGILLAHCPMDVAFDRAEQLRHAIGAIPLQDVAVGMHLSASFGVACTDRVGHDLQRLLVDADHSLYRAKHSGRNRVLSSDIAEAQVADGIGEPPVPEPAT